MSQQAFAYAEDFATRMAERAFMDAVRQAVANISIKELAFRLDVSPSLLSDALAERSNKGVRGTWLVTVIQMAPLADALAILNTLGDLRRIESMPRKELTAEEKAERLEEKLRTLGPTGLRLIEEALGGKL
jgi:hypothetical protein